MPIQVYGIAMSTCTQRVFTTLIEKGLKYELVPVNLLTGEQKVKLRFKKLIIFNLFVI
jgi:glutathione S-transferase